MNNWMIRERRGGFHYSHGNCAGSCSEDLFALIDESKVVGMGNLERLRENESMITDRLLLSPLVRSKKYGIPDDLDDELDDDI